MQVKSLEQIVNQINKDLGPFCDTFRYKRKELSGASRAASGGMLFKFNDDGRDYAINEGGGTQIQYHVFLRDGWFGYGIGFNAQYVRFANEKSPWEYIEPFVKSFLILAKRNDPTILSLRNKGYEFDDTKPENMGDGDYSLLGKYLKVDNEEIPDAQYQDMIEDIKGVLFDLYTKVWKGVKSSIMEYKNLTYVAQLEHSKNLILNGAPGTGKTYLAKQIASAIILNKDYSEIIEEDPVFKDRCRFVQFHPSYDYTDFVEGLRPVGKDKELGFKRIDGIFKAFCAKAAEDDESNKYVFIIDEINRGEMSKIFGELFFSIDPGYRGKRGIVSTQYQNLVEEKPFNNGFYVPENVFIIGTMNDIDRSVESMDFAFRRRFAFREVKANSTADMLDCLENIEKGLAQLAKDRMNAINAQIENTEGLSSAYHIGAGYFLKLKDYPDVPGEKKFQNLWDYQLKGLIQEYLRGMPDPEAYKEIAKVYGAQNL